MNLQGVLICVSKSKPLTEIFCRFADYYNIKYQKEDIVPLSTWKPVYREILEDFEFVVNGTGTDIIDPQTKMNIPGFHMTIYRNGWLCGVVTPFEGTIITGTEGPDLEAVIIDLLERHIKKLKLYFT